MPAYQFKNATSNAVGISGAEVYTVPAAKKSIMIGCSVSNVTGGALPVEVQLIKADSTIIHLSTSTKLPGGTTLDLFQGKKLVLDTGEKIKVLSKVDSSFDVIVSVLEDVD
tara:strand:+ start:393 stop:725 length:333 start_codon:yes stop_codon:yes gene_type:complete